MISTYLYGFLSVLAVSAVSFAGVFTLSLKEVFLRKYIYVFISLAVGALLGDAFIHLIPESLEQATNPAAASLLIVAGICLFFIVEKFFHWHHHGEDANASHHLHPVGKLVLISDGIHNIMDGVIIGLSFFAGIPLGIATTIAVILHEIPQEIGDFAVLLHAGYTKRRALLLNFISALTAFAGLAIAFLLQGATDGFTMWALPFAAGGFIYIAIADLVPELHKTKELQHSIMQIIALAAGVAAMLALTFIE